MARAWIDRPEVQRDALMLAQACAHPAGPWAQVSPGRPAVRFRGAELTVRRYATESAGAELDRGVDSPRFLQP
jgi:hypothetical protein